MSNKLTVGRPIKGPPYRQFICKPPPPHRRTVRPGVGVRFFFKDSPRSERSRRSFQKEDTRGPRGFLKTLAQRTGPLRRVRSEPTWVEERGGLFFSTQFLGPPRKLMSSFFKDPPRSEGSRRNSLKKKHTGRSPSGGIPQPMWTQSPGAG